MKNQTQRVVELQTIITTRIADINTTYRGGPSLHFYNRVSALRVQHPNVAAFLSSNECIDMIYATLVSWDMNSRAAKMADYGEFKGNILKNLDAFKAVEAAEVGFTWTNRHQVVQALTKLYANL